MGSYRASARVCRRRDPPGEATLVFVVGKGSGEEIQNIWSKDRSFEPLMDERRREMLYKGWKKAVIRSMNWEED